MKTGALPLKLMASLWYFSRHQELMWSARAPGKWKIRPTQKRRTHERVSGNIWRDGLEKGPTFLGERGVKMILTKAKVKVVNSLFGFPPQAFVEKCCGTKEQAEAFAHQARRMGLGTSVKPPLPANQEAEWIVTLY